MKLESNQEEYGSVDRWNLYMREMIKMQEYDDRFSIISSFLESAISRRYNRSRNKKVKRIQHKTSKENNLFLNSFFIYFSSRKIVQDRSK